jgi:hypothetical protein
MSVQEGAAAPPVAGQIPASRAKSLRRGNFSAFLMLVVQYGLGMYVSLYVTVPAADQGKGIGKALSNGPAGITIHILLGLLLILSAIGVLVQAVLARHPVLIALGAIGLVALAGAAFEGGSFVSSGHDAASMWMAMLTGVGLLCYGTSLFLLAPPRAALR